MRRDPLAPTSVRAGERILDVGAGCGDTTLELARRVGPGGHVHAVDVSEIMLARARERARIAGVGNVSFQLGDRCPLMRHVTPITEQLIKSDRS